MSAAATPLSTEPPRRAASAAEARTALPPLTELAAVAAVGGLVAVFGLAMRSALTAPAEASPLGRCVVEVGGEVMVARPTFCNVPHWAELSLYVMSMMALALFGYGVWRHAASWLDGRSGAPARNLGRPGTRLGFLIRDALLQRKSVQRPFPGVFHSGMYGGFVLLLIGTILATVDWDITRQLFGSEGDPLAGRILTGPFYLAYEAVLDAAGLAFLIGLGMAIWRRHVAEPHHVKGSWDFLLWSLVVINLSGFLVEALRLVITVPRPAFGAWSWLGSSLADLVLGVAGGPSPQLAYVAGNAHLGLWLVHAAASLLFIAALPYSNAIHIVTVSANAWFQTTEPIPPGAALQKLDLEGAEVWGVGSLADLTWKQRLGVDSCVRCGRCETVCPAYMSGTPLNPKQIIVSLSGALRQEAEGPFLVGPSGELLVGPGLLVEPDALWACTTCMACVQACPAFIEIVDDIVDMRRYLALNEGALPGSSSLSLKNMGTAGNPWGYPQSDRLAWAEGLDLPVAQAGEHYDVLYWVGCSASYDKRNQKIARSLVGLMREAGVSFAVMREERCTCESARRLGEEYLYQTATEANIATLSGFSFDRVVCHCPHCFNTIKNEYPQFGGDFEVVHHSQLLAELVADGRIARRGAEDGSVVFHDSCYLGRYNGEYQAPRDTLAAAGMTVLDPERSRENGLCCGGGGGKMWFEGHAEKEVNLIRMEELLAAKPDVIGVACPYCLTMLDSAAKSMGASDVKIRDIAEVLAESGPGAAA